MDDDALLPELADSPGHLAWRASAAVTATIAAELPHGIDIHAYAALVALWDLRPHTQRELASAIGVSRVTMAKTSSALVADGLAERVRNPDDRRSVSLTMTAEGKRAIARWRGHVDALEAAYGGGFSSTELRELRDLLYVLVEPVLGERTPDELRYSVGFLVTRLHAHFHAAAAEALRDLELEPRHLGTLIILSQGRTQSQSELAGHLGVSGPTVVGIVDHLAYAGVVRRVRNVDRRLNIVELTMNGELVARDALERGRAVAKTVLKPLSTPERERLRALLVRLVTAD